MVKRWTYEQITVATEGPIGRLDMMATRPNYDDNMKSVVRDMAFGVVMCWHEITMGYQREGDYDRLHALADAVGRVKS